jgi:hypothetical protein
MDPPSNQVDTLLINTLVNLEGSRHSLCRRVGVQHELSLRGIIMTMSRVLILELLLLILSRQTKITSIEDSVISQQVSDPLKALGHDESDHIDGRCEGSRVRSTYFNEDISNFSIPATRIGTYVNNVGGRLGLGYDSRLAKDSHFFMDEKYYKVEMGNVELTRGSSSSCFTFC